MRVGLESFEAVLVIWRNEKGYAPYIQMSEGRCCDGSQAVNGSHKSNAAGADAHAGKEIANNGEGQECEGAPDGPSGGNSNLHV